MPVQIEANSAAAHRRRQGGYSQVVVFLARSQLRTPVFRTGDRTYTWLDVLLDAMLHGDWADFERHLIHGQACAAEAERTDRWPDAAEIEAASNDFRYARDLLTSEETEAWLERVGFDMDVWSTVLTRDVLRSRWPDLAVLLAGAGAVTTIEETLISAEGICSGLFTQFAQRLAERAAVARTSDDPGSEANVITMIEAARTRNAPWLAALPDRELDESLRHLGAIASRAGSALAAAITPAALAVHLERYRLDWLRVDLERLDFDTEAAAREAEWCVREDGLTLSEVAIESRRSVMDQRALLDALPVSLRPAVLSASPGELVGPIEVEGRFVVAHLVAKTSPTLDDAVVRARAERSIGASLRSKAVLAHVTWIERLERLERVEEPTT